MSIDSYKSQYPNPVRGGMLVSLVYMSPLQGFAERDVAFSINIALLTELANPETSKKLLNDTAKSSNDDARGCSKKTRSVYLSEQSLQNNIRRAGKLEVFIVKQAAVLVNVHSDPIANFPGYFFKIEAAIAIAESRISLLAFGDNHEIRKQLATAVFHHAPQRAGQDFLLRRSGELADFLRQLQQTS